MKYPNYQLVPLASKSQCPTCSEKESNGKKTETLDKHNFYALGKSTPEINILLKDFFCNQILLYNAELQMLGTSWFKIAVKITPESDSEAVKAAIQEYYAGHHKLQSIDAYKASFPQK